MRISTEPRMNLLHLFTFIRGRKRIDYMFGSAGIVTHTTAADIEEFHDGVAVSDYRGHFADINFRAILHGDAADMAPVSLRGIQSTIPDIAKK
jgi:hypothetical protein